MLISTRAIVVEKNAYNDNYALANLLTREMGFASFRIPLRGGRHSMAERLRRSLSPLTELSLVADYRPNRPIQSIREATISPVRLDIINHPQKREISFFLAEVLSKLFRNARTDETVYDYIGNSLNVFETLSQGIENFHLYFLINLLVPCGIAPDWEDLIRSYTPGSSFNLEEVHFTSDPIRGISLSARDTAFLMDLIRISPRNLDLYRLNGRERRRILDYILEYYRIHLGNFGKLRTTEVLSLLQTPS